MLILGILSVALGLLAILAGATDIARAIDPAWLAQRSDFLYQLPAIAPAVACALLAIILVIVCRSLARGRTRRRYGTSGAIFAAVLGLIIALVSLPITNISPGGLIKPGQGSAKDLPTNSTAAQQQVETATGKCNGGWNSLDTTNFPGVSSVSVCASNQLAFAVFDNPAIMSIIKTPLQSQAVNYLTEHLSPAQVSALPPFASLTGSQWIAIGPDKAMTALQQHQGGVLSELGQPAKSGS